MAVTRRIVAVDCRHEANLEAWLSGLTIRLLGDARAMLNGVEIRVDTRKAIALLAWLAVTGREHRRETLAALLWPDADDARARAALRRTLSALSGALNGGWLLATRDRVGLDVSGIDLDVIEFERLLAVTGPRERKALEQAVERYRGDFMAGFSLRDSPEFDDWQREQADALRTAFGSALDRLVTLTSDAGDWSAAIGYARRRLTLDPLHEDAHRRLMQIYASAGDRSAALRQYRDCVRILDQELGVAPVEATTALYQAIQDERFSPIPVNTAVSARTAAPPSPPVVTQPAGYPMVGREREIAEIDEIWNTVGPDGRLIAIEGEAGIGKTRLVEATIAAASERGQRALCLRCYEGETQLAFGPIIDGLQSALAQPAMAAALERLPHDDSRELARLVPAFGATNGPAGPLDNPGAQVRFFNAIIGALQIAVADDHPGLLVVEDAHWIDEASLDLLGYLTRRLAGRPLLLILTWRTEHVGSDHRLRTMTHSAERAGIGRSITLDRLTAEDMRMLVGDGAEQLGARLYRESEGVPFFAVEYLDQLHRQAIPAEGEHWPLPAGPRALLEQRIAGLTATEGQVLTTLAVIGRDASFDLVRDVSGRSDEETAIAIDGLLAQQVLVERAIDGNRHDPVYAIRHDKLREVAHDQMSLARRRLLHRRVAEVLRRQARGGAGAAQIALHLQLGGQDREAAEAYREAGEGAAALYATSEAIGHYRAALALGQPDSSGLHERIGDLLTRRGAYEPALLSYQTAAALRLDTGQIEHKIGLVYQRMGNWSLASQHFAAAEPLYEAEADSASAQNLARLAADWSLTTLRMGALEQATALGLRARQVAEETGDELALAQSDNLLGILARSTYDSDAARRHFEAALARATRLGEPSIRAAVLNNVARVVQESGDSHRAIALAEEALALTVTHGDRHHEAALHSNLADLLHLAGRVEDAQEHLRASVAIYAEIGIVAGEYQPEIWKLTEW